jgi:hypothetical protein
MNYKCCSCTPVADRLTCTHLTHGQTLVLKPVALRNAVSLRHSFYGTSSITSHAKSSRNFHCHRLSSPWLTICTTSTSYGTIIRSAKFRAAASNWAVCPAYHAKVEDSLSPMSPESLCIESEAYCQFLQPSLSFRRRKVVDPSTRYSSTVPGSRPWTQLLE